MRAKNNIKVGKEIKNKKKPEYFIYTKKKSEDNKFYKQKIKNKIFL